MERVNVYLGLGSNLGNRELNLLKAVNLLDEAFGTHPERISRILDHEGSVYDIPLGGVQPFVFHRVNQDGLIR